MFYPASKFAGSATLIRVGSGEERSGVDFQLAPVPTSRVSGIVMGPEGPVAKIGLSLVATGFDDLTRESEFETATSVSDADGTFTFLAVPSGQYIIRALTSPRPAPEPPPASGPAPPPLVSTDPTWWTATPVSVGVSDTTGVAVAAAIGADVCEIYTDVDGVYTTDPNVCPSAKKIDRISFEEMLELASLGAKVLQIRSVEVGMKYNVPIHVRSSFNDKPGTMVVGEEGLEGVVVSGIAYDKGEAKVQLVGVTDKPGVVAKVFGLLAEKNVSVDMIIQSPSRGGGSTTDVTFTVAKTDLTRVKEVIEATATELNATVEYDPDIVKVSIVGLGMRSHAGIASKMFGLLAAEGINIQAISTSEIKISCIIHSKYTELAVRALHEGFGLDKASVTGA
jgi:predicted amino acid-binding ACT domain protein